MQEQIQGFLLSPQQKQFWLLQHNSQVYRNQCAILLEGNLKIEVLKAALQQVVDRHEILRTTFHWTRGIKLPIQVITHDSHFSIQEIDFSAFVRG
ncbi:MAG: condensation domain-containing protein [Coleofasciculus sp. S288]|nr:condensation domain-containing protein [Coleofasciculus sp. S288]